ncbi:oligogalacturonate lyase family protein [Kribbella sp. NPDC054772]
MTELAKVAVGAHLTYPHANGFHAGGDRLATVRWDPERLAFGIASVPWRDPRSHDVREICTVLGQHDGEGTVWFDVARSAERLVGVWANALHLVDLADEASTPETVYRAPYGCTLQALVSINAAGDRALISEEWPGSFRLLEVDLATGAVEELHDRTWWANHAHYCPADEGWIGFSHEGTADSVPDRVWARHGTELPAGGCVLTQPEDLFFGHERWAHHAVGAVVVAYGISPGERRGLYWTSPDEPAGRLLSRGDRFWHCDISRDGTLAVVDTTGPADQPGTGWDGGNTSDVLLVDLRDGRTTPLARTLATRHPAHPHPIFAPDGSAVLFNNLDPDGTVSISRVDI